MTTNTPKITIVTATLNADRVLPHLIESLQKQTDRDFRWVVADGLSNDATISLLENATDLNPLITRAKDFGIYDALNRSLQHVDGGYYLVVGADDTLEINAIENYRDALKRFEQPDFIAAGIRQDGQTVAPRVRLGWLYGLQGVASSHAVGLLIKRDLHERYGLYSNKFPIAADQLFVKTALQQGATIGHAGFIAGEFGTQGLSGGDPLGVLTEIFRVQMRTERHKSLQVLLFTLRLTKYVASALLRRRW